ncbi:hypothetical protein [Blastococcus litoris]|uniref:hypothetical protein n=1 Tax=Blastococcus litoris TaxID=2171622 RepID=UPI0019D2061F|nr:hypothetical protein [Blastococcus litoris]
MTGVRPARDADLPLLREIERAAARARDLPAITLTTFTDVPWNGPYYDIVALRATPRPRAVPRAR